MIRRDSWDGKMPEEVRNLGGIIRRGRALEFGVKLVEGFKYFIGVCLEGLSRDSDLGYGMGANSR